MSEESDLTSHHSQYNKEKLLTEVDTSSSNSSSEQLNLQPGALTKTDHPKQSKQDKYQKIAKGHDRKVSRDSSKDKQQNQSIRPKKEHNRNVSHDLNEVVWQEVLCNQHNRFMSVDSII